MFCLKRDLRVGASGFLIGDKQKKVASGFKKSTSPPSICKSNNRITMSMITATAWVPRGFAAPFPSKYTFDEEEFQRIAELAKLQLDDAQEELEKARYVAEGNGAEGNGADAMVEDEGSDDEAPTRTLKSKEFVLQKVLQDIFTNTESQ
jgi:hypothetical protein